MHRNVRHRSVENVWGEETIDPFGDIAPRAGMLGRRMRNLMVESPRFAPKEARISGIVAGRPDATNVRGSERADDMRVICSSCVREGRSGYLGDKAPFDDPTPTHSICGRHQEQLLETLPSLSLPGLDMLIVVHSKDVALYAYLRRALAGVRGVHVITDRRRGDRRRKEAPVSEERRRERRRIRRGISLPGCTLVRFRRGMRY